jgi:multiple sugar transport system permease protein
VAGGARILAGTLARDAWWRRRAARRAATFYALTSPWIIGSALLTAVPLALAFGMSFTNYDGLNAGYLQFVGLENYARAAQDPDALHSLERLLVLIVVVVPLSLAVQLGLALMLDQRIRGVGAFRTLFYLPSIVPPVGAAWVWKIFTDAQGGLLNAIIGIARPDTYIAWIVEHPTAVLVLLTVWAAAGGGMVVFLAGLQGIPAELREAAMIDGADPWRIARHITLPLLTPVIFFQLVMGLILTLQILVPPILLAPGVTRLGPGVIPPSDNYFFVVHAYNKIFVNQLFGYGSALLWILFAIILGLTLLLFRTSRRWVYYGAEA